MTTGNPQPGRARRRLAFGMLVPTFCVVAALVVFPVLWNLWLSLKPVMLADLRDRSLLDLGFTTANFRTVFADPDFARVLATTLVYTIGGSLLSIVLGLAAALLVREKFVGRGLVRGLLLSPYVAPVVAVTFTWSFLLDPQLGVVNWAAVEHGILTQPVPFLSQRSIEVDLLGSTLRLPLALATVIAFEGWRYFPFAFLFILARLQSIPAELYQAAAVDGAGPLRRFFHITLPQLGTVLAVLFLFRFIWTLNKFDDIFLLTRGQAGTKVMSITVYDYAFGRQDIGAGCAVAIVLFLVLAAFLFFYLKVLREEE